MTKDTRTRTSYLIGKYLKLIKDNTYPPDGAWFETSWEARIRGLLRAFLEELEPPQR